MNLQLKRKLRQKRVWRIRKRIHGTAERPRLCVHFSNKNTYAQAIDDERGHTLVSLSTVDKAMRDQPLTANCESAAALGKRFAEKALEAGVERVVFDRNGRLFHGAVKAFAEAAREGGLQF